MRVMKLGIIFFKNLAKGLCFLRYFELINFFEFNISLVGNFYEKNNSF